MIWLVVVVILLLIRGQGNLPSLTKLNLTDVGGELGEGEGGGGGGGGKERSNGDVGTD